MSELKRFDSIEAIKKWWRACDSSLARGYLCPVCGEDAAECRHRLPEMAEAYAHDRKSAGGEVRITDPATGGQKGQKIERFDLIPIEPLVALARLYGRGAEKYADDNWRKGYAWRLSIGAAFRHFTRWLCRESYDTRDGLKGGPIDIDTNGKPIHTGEHHLICVIWHCCTLYSFELHRLGTDDRAATAEP